MGKRELISYLSIMRIVFMLCLIISPFLGYSQARRAQSHIEKKKYEEAAALLIKSIHKDSLAAAEKYVLAGLFIDSAYHSYDIDSAYFYIIDAINSYGFLDPKLKQTLSNRGFSEASFNKLKAKIEEAGFERAVKLGREADFINFIDEFNSSIYLDSAITLRNSLAFGYASQQNTYQAYHHFFVTYPEAQEVPEAKNRYEKLLYEDKTGDRRLHSYQQFLEEYPNTRYRKEAEQHIFNIITGKFTVKAYKTFLRQYPHSFLRNRALLIMYSLLSKEEQNSFLNSDQLSASQNDSIRNLITLENHLYVPIIHDHQYEIINDDGQVVLGPLTDVSEEVKCRPIEGAMLFASFSDHNAIITLKDQVIIQGDFNAYRDEGDGIIKLTGGLGDFFIHLPGIRLNNHYFNKATTVGPFIAYFSNNKWGLESVTGLSLLRADYDSISIFHQKIILQKNNKWGLLPVEAFYQALDKEPVVLEMLYDNISTVNDQYLLLKLQDSSALIDGDGQFIVPMAIQDIELVEGGIFVDRTDSVMDSRIADSWYYDIGKNASWAYGDKGDSTDVFFQNKLVFKVKEADLVGTTALKVTREDSAFCYFQGSTRIYLEEGGFIVPVHRMGEFSKIRHFVYTHGDGGKTVYNQQGKVVDIKNFDRLIDLGDRYILRRYKGKLDLLNDEGQVLLKNINGATGLKNGYVSYLVDGKFGLYSEPDSVNIIPKYDRPMILYSDSLFIISTNNLMGIINKYDSVQVPIKYEEIAYLNDTIAALRSNFRWTFWSIPHNQAVMVNASNYWQMQPIASTYYKFFRGIGYGVWSPQEGLILKPTFDEINIRYKGNETLFIAEKWVEEADLVVMLYYNMKGTLLRKEVLSTLEYKDLSCDDELE